MAEDNPRHHRKDNTIEKIMVIQEKMKKDQDRQKRYVDQRKRPLEFYEGDNMF